MINNEKRYDLICKENTMYYSLYYVLCKAGYIHDMLRYDMLRYKFWHHELQWNAICMVYRVGVLFFFFVQYDMLGQMTWYNMIRYHEKWYATQPTMLYKSNAIHTICCDMICCYIWYEIIVWNEMLCIGYTT